MMHYGVVPRQDTGDPTKRDDWLEVAVMIGAISGLCAILGIAISGLMLDLTTPQVSQNVTPVLQTAWVSDAR
ncbi:hypothetical protein GTA62_01745 [Roseobacter sp. HKCCD9010]|jgi:hypothetical protein|uniref:hypothetical protein n=2 Tax=Alphaproteobacteria TaxID=28211 RepID=UPI00119B69B8|nr:MULTISPECIES: hypothetical protein [Rhodobacterales]MBF9049413.1 hypothetical protein [Rhodobacterales bacterium HKCCD4356]NNW86922.1 hypothetical protein [Roseobacter sp. HKCCD8272]NNW95441.1 hypothetical protein [Roseobacter sp. HKCCD9159]NNX03952.1 hypothetical protein [Roseobacter sp. HKCCD5919]NNX89104.1 hypothetical protein [Roseobacter sp. HKCCD9056]NNY40241.1 hypothetical protein [Roseobacter sp. HKCCD8831]NNZ50972.1 hypothetical protein [Roseobacter sp. HKCCD6502]NNZ72257.1 hypo